MISVEDLTKRYGDFTALHGLTFEISGSGVYGFLGPNGAGKSTTLNIMTGCLSATGGQVHIEGHDIYQEPKEAKRLIGYLPENPPLYTGETPTEYLQFVAEAKGLRGARIQEQIDEVMERTKITDVRHRRIDALSKGYRQRVGIAQALVGEPRIIILDEPTIGLDPLQIIEIRELIRELGQSHTVIFSSHILSEVQAMRDRILIISRGRLVGFDTPAALEESLVSRGEITLTLDGDRAETAHVLSSVAAVELLDTESVDGGFCRIRARVSDTDFYDVSRALFWAFADAKMPIVFRHELRASFHSFTAYLFGGFLLCFVGIGALLYNIQQAVSNFELVLSFGSIVFAFIVPILTMRTITEERKQKTDQLLYSLPISTTEVVLGKFLALLVVFAVPMLIISFYPLVFARFGEVYLPTAYSAILAYFLLGAALIAVGVFISSLTDNQGFAAGIGIAVILLNYYSVSLSEFVSSTSLGATVAFAILAVLLGLLVYALTRKRDLAVAVAVIPIAVLIIVYFYAPSLLEGLLPTLVSSVSLFDRFSAFVNGVFDVTAVVFYLSVMAFFRFLTVQSLEKRRYA